MKSLRGRGRYISNFYMVLKADRLDGAYLTGGRTKADALKFADGYERRNHENVEVVRVVKR